MFGNKVYIDAEIAVDGTLSLKDAHAIAEDVARQCRKEVSEYKAYYDSCKSGINGKNTAAFKILKKLWYFFFVGVV